MFATHANRRSPQIYFGRFNYYITTLITPDIVSMEKYFMFLIFFIFQPLYCLQNWQYMQSHISTCSVLQIVLTLVNTDSIYLRKMEFYI